MPKYRKLHVKTTESLDINDMPDDFTRLFWVLLPLALDREGRGLDSTAWLKAKVFPLREDPIALKISDAMDWFAQRGMVERYCVGGRSYFWLPTFARYQGDTSAEAASLYPAPSEETVSAYAPPPVEVPTNLQPTPDLLPTNSTSDTYTDPTTDTTTTADADPDHAAVAAPSPAPVEKPKRERAEPMPDALTAFLELFNAKRFANRTQRNAVAQLDTDYGSEKLLEAGRWAAERGLGLGQAVGAVKGALPKWGQSRASPKPANSGNGSEPKGWAGIREWDRMRKEAQEAG